MPPTQDFERQQIINKVIEYINKKCEPKKAKLLCAFAEQVFGPVALEDLLERSINDLFGAINSHWDLIAHRRPGETKISIYNPNYEQNAWQSTHTIVEISHDDMPFLVDSLRMEIDRMGYTIHLIIHFGGLKLRRNKEGEVTEVLPFNSPVGEGVYAEAPIYIEIDRQTHPETLAAIKENLLVVLEQVRSAVEDWSQMRGKMREAIQEIAQIPQQNYEEVRDFLRWLENDHFTFLGYQEYEVTKVQGAQQFTLIPHSTLGVLRQSEGQQSDPLLSKITLDQGQVIISKTNVRSKVHRPVYQDYIAVLRVEQGKIIGLHRFIGLYTSSAYHSNPKYIPLIREKVAIIMKDSNLSLTGHAGKALLNILETLPRDDLFQASIADLQELSRGILHLQERKRIRLFAREDVYGNFISCLVFVPRERFTTELALVIKHILADAFSAVDITFSTQFSESVLAAIHYFIRLDPQSPITYDLKSIEQKLIEAGRSWKEDLKEYLLEYFGEEQGNILFDKYQHAFPAGYREAFAPKNAIADIEQIETLTAFPLAMDFYDNQEGTLCFKLFRLHEFIPLSDALPIFENMGLRVIDEKPYEISLPDGTTVWINDFHMEYTSDLIFNIHEIKTIFQKAFFHIWHEDAENDGFNRLVLRAKLNWREISVLRAYTKYLRQTEFIYSQSYIESCLAKHAHIAATLMNLFLCRFDPSLTEREAAIEKYEFQIKKELDEITLLDEDRILRRFHEVINATLRTNYFQKDSAGKYKYHISLKLDPRLVSDLPLPLPMFEIFIYSPAFEGVHLRTAKVARGGIRWSDRREDFRTEVLGLMRTQKVKNVVIVPSGAKGGFVVKNIKTTMSREEFLEEGIKCYKGFISGLLDITDNLVNGVRQIPPNVICYDDEDPYLVVAADKGTASFSDIANAISQEYQFWLGDAFASGGSMGYDHKKMGITAKGAWESVKRHFRELGMDIQKEDFTVIGIGDMAGDVFGNGMLLSKHIKLVGAFNHQHIFIDPNPDIALSYEERVRLFNLPRSTWENYNPEVISKGGGVFSRSSKSITLSPEIKELLGLKKDFIVPHELIREMLTAKVDLIWNGGIGTFVKASSETNSEVGDRTNDILRVNGQELRCKVIGEGGNLGFTQLGRVEYALNNGHIYTDFIDNSAGVDCSDHEVNIKIAFNDLLVHGDISLQDRNTLLVEMEPEVAALVLEDNYQQTLAISLIDLYAPMNIELHNRYMQELVRDGQIKLKLEGLPDEHQLLDRKAQNKGLTRPEIAVLLAYCKILTKKEILNSDLPEDRCVNIFLQNAFPMAIQNRYRAQMESHPLRREIVATVLSNLLVNEMGFTFLYQLQSETGSSVPTIVQVYLIARHIFRLQETWSAIEKLDGVIPAIVQAEMMVKLARLIRRAARWFLRNRPKPYDVELTCEQFSPLIRELQSKVGVFLIGASKDYYEESKHKYFENGVPMEIASVIAAERAMISALDIIEASEMYGFKLEEVAATYYTIGENLDLGWFREQINVKSVENEWEALAQEACRDDLDGQQRNLAITILKSGIQYHDIEEKIQVWTTQHELMINRWHNILNNLRNNPNPDFVMITVAMRELMALTQTSNVKTSSLGRKSDKTERKPKIPTKRISKIIHT